MDLSVDHVKEQPVLFELVDLLVNHYDFDADKDTCLICMGLLRHPVKCGNCNSCFCRQCANNWNIRRQRCPKKCSEGGWNFKLVRNPKVFRFQCPFSEKCPIMATTDAIEAHLKPNGCEIMRRNQVKTQTCSLGHVLNLFTAGGKQEYRNQACNGCRRKGIHMKSECVTCRVLFCVGCKPLPLTKTICMAKEKHECTKKFGQAFICDRCGRKALQLEYGHFDEICRLAVCARCHDKLPEPRRKESPEK